MSDFYERVINELEEQIDKYPVNEIREQHVCLENVSKTFEAKLKLLYDVPLIQKCEDVECITSKEVWSIEPCKTVSYKCDGELSRKHLARLMGSFVSASGMVNDDISRGVQNGRIRLLNGSGDEIGKVILLGNSLIESHHQPIDPNPDCFRKNHMEGQLRGIVHFKEKKYPSILRAQYAANYKINKSRTRGTLEGTIEGSIINYCKQSK